MGGLSLEQLGDDFTVDGYTCPWCPIVVMVVDCADSARRFMESHLDGHFAQPIGRPELLSPRAGRRHLLAG